LAFVAASITQEKKIDSDLNNLYKTHRLTKQFSPEGFEWINYSDHQNAVVSFIRKGNDQKNDVIIVCNFTPVILE
jgi:1,4-alpha-glucan branching enzyme